MDRTNLSRGMKLRVEYLERAMNQGPEAEERAVLLLSWLCAQERHRAETACGGFKALQAFIDYNRGQPRAVRALNLQAERAGHALRFSDNWSGRDQGPA